MMKVYLLLIALTAALGSCGFDTNQGSTILDARDTNTQAPSILSDEEPVRLLSAILQQTVCSSCMALSGEIELKNMAYNKAVDVFYGCALNESDPNSEWKWRSEPALFQASDVDDREVWKFKIDSPGCYSKARVAIRYQVSGKTFWDNNCGWNYHVVRPDGAPAGRLNGRQSHCSRPNNMPSQNRYNM